MLSRRKLNRALLARQWLLARVKKSAVDALEHLVGVQAQVPNVPYLTLWSRLEGFRHADLSDLIRDRIAVRLALQRSTIHLLTTRDALALRPVLHEALERSLYKGSPYGKKLGGLDIAKLLVAARALVDEEPGTISELSPLLKKSFPKHDAESMAYAARALLALVQVPPRGMWRGVGQATLTTLEAWAGQPLATSAAPDAMIRRYLAAFGPASVTDAHTWSGLSVATLAPVFERLRGELATFRDERGGELFDVPGAPFPEEDAPAPVRLLAEYDNVTLAHADRSRIVDEAIRKKVPVENGLSSTILVDGFVQAIWRVDRSKKKPVLRIRPLAKLTTKQRDEIAAEAEALIPFWIEGPATIAFR